MLDITKPVQLRDGRTVSWVHEVDVGYIYGYTGYNGDTCWAVCKYNGRISNKEAHPHDLVNVVKYEYANVYRAFFGRWYSTKAQCDEAEKYLREDPDTPTHKRVGYIRKVAHSENFNDFELIPLGE